MSESSRGMTQRSTIQFKLQILDGSGNQTLYFRGSALTAHSPTKDYLSIYFLTEESMEKLKLTR